MEADEKCAICGCSGRRPKSHEFDCQECGPWRCTDEEQIRILSPDDRGLLVLALRDRKQDERIDLTPAMISSLLRITSTTCLVCDDLVIGRPSEAAYQFDWDCNGCGKWSYHDHFISGQEITNLSQGDRSALAWALRARDKSQRIFLDRLRIEALVESAPRWSVVDRKARVLLKIASQAGTPNTTVPEEEILRTWPVFRAESKGEVLTYIEWLEKGGLLENRISTGFSLQLSEKGWLEAERLVRPNMDSSMGFVAMAFGSTDEEKSNSLSLYNDGFSKGIVSAGYTPERVGIAPHNNKICDEIIASIRRARFLVADLTYARPNVYYEAGFAFGLGIPVYLTCSKEFFETGEEPVGFDIRQYPVLQWSSLADLATQLSARICSLIGQGPAPRA